MKYFKYGNSGGIQAVIAREINGNSGYYDSIEDIIESVRDPRVSNYKASEYCFDHRLNKMVHIITGDRINYKGQFLCFFIEDEN